MFKSTLDKWFGKKCQHCKRRYHLLHCGETFYFEGEVDKYELCEMCLVHHQVHVSNKFRYIEQIGGPEKFLAKRKNLEELKKMGVEGIR
jgi:hypothetical protein